MTQYTCRKCGVKWNSNALYPENYRILCHKCDAIERPSIQDTPEQSERGSFQDSGDVVAIQDINTAVPPSCVIAQIILVVEGCAAFGCLLIGYLQHFDWLMMIGISGLISVPIIWILTTIAIEVHRSRLALQQLLENQ